MIFKFIYLLLNLFELRLYRKRISKLEKKREELKYIFIDDPISSLDDNNAIDVALELVKLIKSSKNKNLHFIISTHHALFYNVLHNGLDNAEKIWLSRANSNYTLTKLSR